MIARRLRGIVEQWVAFWDRREAPVSLALTRILFASVVLSDLVVANIQGAVPTLWASPPAGMGQTPDPSSWWSAPWIPHALWASGVVASLSFAMGALHRFSGALLTLVLIALTRFQPTSDGVDVLVRTIVPILALSQASACWSVDAWLARRRGRPTAELVPAWPRYLILLQLLWVYSSSAQCRDDAAWWPWGGFGAIARVLEDPHFARFSPAHLAGFYPLTQLATLSTMVFELSAPLMLLWALRDPGWQRELRGFARWLPWIWIALGASLHLGIALTMTIGVFPFTVLALYPTLLHPQQAAILFPSRRKNPGK